MENIGISGRMKRNEFVRIIVQCLYSLGYSDSAACLESEACIPCKSRDFELLEKHILNGNLDNCIMRLVNLNDLSEELRSSAVFLASEQFLLECMKYGNTFLALELLRKKVWALKIGREKVHRLAYELLSVRDFGLGCIDYCAVDELRIKLISSLEKLLPPPATLPERRLESLLELAICGQIDRCRHHSSADNISLYWDHHCNREHFPTETIQILNAHQDEVWFVQFSNRGEFLASASKDCSAIIWKVEDVDRLTVKHMLCSHKNPISFVSWSPDDTMLLTCGYMEVLKLWDVETGSCKHTFGDNNFIISSCAWFPDSRRLVCGSSDPKKGIYMWDCEGNEIKAWRGVRMPKVLDLAVTPDGGNLVTVFSEKEIRILNTSTNAEHVISEDRSITSLSVSGDSMYLLVNLNSQEIHVWDVAGTWTKPLKYEGHKQKDYIIRSCFGGYNSMFIASGSEDNQVYIWNRKSSIPIEILSGHEKMVNCVSWNPRRLQMLASASDDKTIRVWGPSNRGTPSK